MEAFALGSGHSCALVDGGRVKCWGGNWLGQLGIGGTAPRGGFPGEMGSALPFVDLGPGAEAVRITAGPAAMCAELGSGEVTCWGSGSIEGFEETGQGTSIKGRRLAQFGPIPDPPEPPGIRYCSSTTVLAPLAAS